MKKLAAGMLVTFLAGMWFLRAQSGSSPSAPASDDPLAGLNLNGTTAPAPAQAAEFPGRITRDLVVLDGDRLKTFDSSTLQGIKYWAFYYSASWCSPCRAFTPELVTFYKSFKPEHPDFELIFVNEDQSEEAMTDYMKMDAMSWPAVRFDDIADSGGKRYMGRGIPDLVLVDATGKVLADSFHGSEYVGPEEVMHQIEQIVH